MFSENLVLVLLLALLWWIAVVRVANMRGNVIYSSEIFTPAYGNTTSLAWLFFLGFILLLVFLAIAK